MKVNKNTYCLRISVLLFVGLGLLSSCKSPEKKSELPNQVIQEIPQKIETKNKDKKSNKEEWLEITTETTGILLDIRYATINNFTKKQIYDCPKCYLRPEIAEQLIQLNQSIKEKYNYQFKVFDCYRPRPAQQKLWDIVPNPIYVTPPEKGSMHNRGMAVDLTLVDGDGNVLDMGTEYDFFGRAAHIDNFDLPQNVLDNRVLLQELMKSIGFQTIQSEWWHFSHSQKMFPLSDWEWPCE
jgi:D-alanyl-D-alanine dipeptidase